MTKVASWGIMLTLLFPLLLSSLNIQAVKASPAIIVDPNGNVVPESSPIQKLGNVYTFTGNISDSIEVQRSNIIIDGGGYTLTGPGNVSETSGIVLSGFLYDVNNVTVRNLKVTNFAIGIDLDHSPYSVIHSNTLYNNKQAIFIETSSFNNISQNTITNPIPNPNVWRFNTGIYISGGSYNNIVYDNEVTNNDYGVHLIYSSLNSIFRNNIANNDYGIFISSSTDPIYSSFDITIDENTIANSSDAGIYFQGASHQITVLANTIVNNYRGIYMESLARRNAISGNTIALNTNGIYFANSTGNSLWENNFIDNNEQILYKSPGFANFFNSSYPVGGNFWSNYAGDDFDNGPYQNITGSDALIDTPHTIDADNTDFYPLISRFSDFQASRWYRVGVISNSTVQDLAYFYQNGTVKMHVTNSSATQSSGFMRITIPKGLIGPPYTIAVDAGATTTLNLNDTLYDNATTRWIYFAYQHSTHEITIQGSPDTTPPTISILSPQPRPYNSRDTPLTFTVSEPTSWLRYSLDGQNNITITGNTTITSLTQGSHTVIVYANDRAANDVGGNIGSSPTISFSVDVTLPVILLLSPENKTYGTGGISLIFTVNEPFSWLRYSLDGQSNTTITGNSTLSGLSHGPHTLVVYANDTAGNIGKSNTVHFSVDSMPPTIQILSPENRTYEARGLPLTFTLSESTSWIGYSLDNNANASISGNTTITNLLEGTHTIVIYANDTVGNMGRSTKIYWTIQITSSDTTPPVIQMLSPENRTYTTTDNTVSIPLTFTTNEQLTWRAYSLDNAPNSTITGNTTLTTIPLGSHKVIVYALDTAGNAGASETRYFTVEQPSPEPFPPTWLIIAVAAIIALIAVAVIVFYVRRSRR